MGLSQSGVFPGVRFLLGLAAAGRRSVPTARGADCPSDGRVTAAAAFGAVARSAGLCVEHVR